MLRQYESKLWLVILIVIAVYMCRLLDKLPSLDEQTYQLVLFESDGTELATVYLFFSSLPHEGEWNGELSPNYIREKTRYVTASDKLSVVGNHVFVYGCSKDKNFVHLNPYQPDDYIVLLIEGDGNAENGIWHYATDGGQVSEGTFQIVTKIPNNESLWIRVCE